MGWCSATGIMDRAVEAAEAAVLATAQELLGDNSGTVWAAENTPLIDVVLRPFVAEIASVLRDGDWDCIEESDYFYRFPQEMLGHSDDEHVAYLVEGIKEAANDGETEQVAKLADELAAFRKRKGMA